MSGGALIWLTDNELEVLIGWADERSCPECVRLAEKLAAVREAVACQKLGPRDVG